MSRVVRVEHTYDVSADLLWSSCISYSGLSRTMEGLMSYDGLPPGEMSVGQKFQINLTLTHFFTMRWWIDVIERDDSRRLLRTSERGWLVKSYLHTFTVDELGANRSCLVDEIEFDAGWMSIAIEPLVFHAYKVRDKPRREILGLRPI